MDRKTLEYMTERVDKGRKLVQMIERRRAKLEQLSEGSYSSVSINNRTGHTFQFGSEDGDKRFEFTAKLVPVIRTLLEAEIAALEEELAAL